MNLKPHHFHEDPQVLHVGTSGELSFNFFTIVAAVILVAFIYLMVRPNKYVNDNEVKIDVSKITANK